MNTFNIGDQVRMPGIPFVVEILELGECHEPECDLGRETFRFADPFTGEDDWMHTDEFELAV